MSFDSAIATSADQARGWISTLAPLGSVDLLDQVFGTGAYAAYASSPLGDSADPLALIGITLVSNTELKGHPGAFASRFLDGEPEILLNRNWIKSATTDQITGVLLEEFGHAIDWYVNGEIDTAGDEGLLFAKRITGSNFSESSITRPNRFDHGSIIIDNQTISVEFATTTGFTPANWSSAISGGDATIDTSGTPGSINIVGSDSSSFSPQTADYITSGVISAPGFAKYNWSFINSDLSSGDDRFGYLVGSTFYRLDNGAGSGAQSNYTTPFFSAPSSFGYRVSTAFDSGGSLSATVSNFSFTPISDTYYTRFNQLFSGSLNNGTTFNVGSLLSNDIWIFPDNPTSDSDYTTTFNNNGSINKVWIISSGINEGQPLAIYLTNGKEELGGPSSAEDIWAFNTNPDGTSGTYYILTSGSYTISASSSAQINSSIGLADLDQLRSEQNAPIPNLLSIASNDYNFKIGDTATVTFRFNTPVSGFTSADVTAPSGSLTSQPVSSDGGTTWTATFTPSGNTETTTNAWSVNLAGVQNSSGLSGTGSFSSPNYTVDTIRPTIAITSDKAVMSHGQTALITFTLSEASINFDHSDVVVTRGTLSQWKQMSPTSYTAVFMPTDNNNLNSSISIASDKFTDLAGNDNKDGGDINNSLAIAVAPTAVIRSTRTSVPPGSINKITITLTELSNNFSLSSIRSNVPLRNFKKISNLVYEAEYTAPATGKATLSIIGGSYTDKQGGNASIANPDGLDSIAIDVLTAGSITVTAPTSSGGRGVTGGITVGRAKPLPAVRSSTPSTAPSRLPAPVGRSTSTGLINKR